MPTSAINPLVPISGAPTTQSVRDNFAAAKSEIETLQGQVASITPVYVQNVNPNIPAGHTGLWIQTGLGSGSDITFWVEDGQ